MGSVKFTGSVTPLVSNPGSPSRVNAPPTIRGQAGMSLFGGSLSNSLAGDLEGISANINDIYRILRSPRTVAGLVVVPDVVIPGASALNQVTVMTSPYEIGLDADVITFAAGSSVATLPDAAVIRRRPLWLINAFAASVTLLSAPGDTVAGALSIVLTSGSRYQVMPNA